MMEPSSPSTSRTTPSAKIPMAIRPSSTYTAPKRRPGQPTKELRTTTRAPVSWTTRMSSTLTTTSRTTPSTCPKPRSFPRPGQWSPADGSSKPWPGAISHSTPSPGPFWTPPPLCGDPAALGARASRPRSIRPAQSLPTKRRVAIVYVGLLTKLLNKPGSRIRWSSSR